MKFTSICAIALALLLSVLGPLVAYAEESEDSSVTGKFQMSYGYSPLQSWDGTQASDYVKGTTPPTEYVEAGDSYVVAQNGYTFRDYVFAGWSCNGKVYQPGETIYNVGSDMSFIAQWTRAPRPDVTVIGIVSYSENDVVTSTESVAVGSTVTLKDGLWADGYGRVFGGGSKFLLSETTADFTATTAPANAVTVKYSGADGGMQCAFSIAKGGSFTVDGCYAEKEGYVFSGWEYNGKVYLAGDTCVVEGAMVLSAVWRESSTPAPDYQTVNVSVGEGGSATPAGKSTVLKGESFTFTVKADSGYRLLSVLCDGQELGTGGTYTLTIRTDTNITVSFERLATADVSTDNGTSSSTVISDSTSTAVDSQAPAPSSDSEPDGNGTNTKVIALAVAGVCCAVGIVTALLYNNKKPKRKR